MTLIITIGIDTDIKAVGAIIDSICRMEQRTRIKKFGTYLNENWNS